MKQCKECKKEKEQTEFYGVQGECKTCTKKRVKENYRKNIDHYIEYEKTREQTPERKAKKAEYQRTHRAKYPNKYRARRYVANAIKYGKLIKQPCEVCGAEKVEAHHTDYRSPLKVNWLCRKHHMEAEGKITYLKD